jgi:CRP/FNR family transcriptional regulator, nitrogen oxide reductase regulator
MSNETDPSSLARRLLFRELDFNVIARVSGAAVTREMPAGTILFSQSNEPTQVHFIVSGVVKLSQSTENGPRFVLTYRGPGSLLGCLAVFGSKPHVYTALAVKDTCVLSWTAAGFEGCLRQCPAISRNALMIVSEHANEAFQRVREFASDQVEQRIARAIQRSETVFFSDIGNPANYWLPLSRQDIAEMSGATLFTASRVMKEWERLGILQSGRRRFKLLDRAGLASRANLKLSAASSERIFS